MPKESLLQKKVKKLATFIAPVKDIAAGAAGISEKLVIEPNMPVGVYVQEAANVHAYAQNDRDILVGKGLDWGIVEEMPRRIEHLRHCEILWWNARFGVTPHERQYLEIKQLSEKVGSELLRDFEFLASNNDDIKYAVDNIKKGSGDTDFMFDLNSLYLLTEREKEKLKAIGSNSALLDDIKYCAKSFPYMLVEFELEQSLAAYKQTERNQAYTFLLVVVEEVRRCAKHAFWNDKKHLRGYLSEYFRKMRK